MYLQNINSCTQRRTRYCNLPLLLQKILPFKMSICQDGCPNKIGAVLKNSRAVPFLSVSRQVRIRNGTSSECRRYYDSIIPLHVSAGSRRHSNNEDIPKRSRALPSPYFQTDVRKDMGFFAESNHGITLSSFRH